MDKFKLYDYKSPVDFTQYEPMTPKEAVCAKCMDCCCYSAPEVKACQTKTCPLWPLKNKWFKIPKHHEYTDEERAMIRERFNKKKV